MVTKCIEEEEDGNWMSLGSVPCQSPVLVDKVWYLQLSLSSVTCRGWKSLSVSLCFDMQFEETIRRLGTGWQRRKLVLGYRGHPTLTSLARSLVQACGTRRRIQIDVDTPPFTTLRCALEPFMIMGDVRSSGRSARGFGIQRALKQPYGRDLIASMIPPSLCRYEKPKRQMRYKTEDRCY